MKLSVLLNLTRNLGKWTALLGAVMGLCALGMQGELPTLAGVMATLCIVLIGLGVGIHLVVGGGPPMPDEAKRLLEQLDEKIVTKEQNRSGEV